MKLLLIPAACLLLSACSNNKKTDKEKESPAQDTAVVSKDVTNVPPVGKEKTITGAWKPVEMNIREMEEEEKKDMIANVRIEFTADGKFFGYNKDKKQEGTYTYDEKDGLLTVLNSARAGKTEKFTIGWENDLLLMTNEEGTVKLKKQ